MAFKESHSRSITKAILWRSIVVVSDSIIVYTITQKVDLTASLVALKNISTTILYYFHERLWNSIAWGKQKRK